MDNKKILEVIEKQTRIFFQKIGGKVLDVKVFSGVTFSSPGQPLVCPNYYIEFNNPSLFGLGDYADDVYPRYRKMRSDWKNALAEAGIEMFVDAAPGFVPCLSLESQKSGETYLAKPLFLSGQVIPIGEIDLPYYHELKQKFNLRFALKESGGLLIGPEGGMLRALEAIVKLSERISNFVDIGAGTGELSAYLIKQKLGDKIIVNEVSGTLINHLSSYLGATAKEHGANINFQFNDCRRIILPTSSDLISVGVFYGFQPSLIEEKGLEFKKALGDSGVLLIQSSMPETLFNLHVLLGDCEGINNWPWYKRTLSLPYYFNYYLTCYLDNEFITLASQSKSRLLLILEKLEGALVYNRNF